MKDAEIEEAIDDADPSRVSTDPLTTGVETEDPERTVPRSGPQDGSPRSEPASSWPDTPKVPGYEVIQRLGHRETPEKYAFTAEQS